MTELYHTTKAALAAGLDLDSIADAVLAAAGTIAESEAAGEEDYEWTERAGMAAEEHGVDHDILCGADGPLDRAAARREEAR